MLLTLVPDPLRWSVSDPHADCSKTSLELSFRAGAPTDGAPSGIGQHVFSRYRQSVGDVPLTATAVSGNRPDHLHIGRVDLERGMPTAQASLRNVSPARSAHN